MSYVTPLTPVQIFKHMTNAGFPPVVAVTMTAIALRESAGIPTAFNGNTATGDTSYGLLQINMMNAGVAALIKKEIPQVAADVKALFDPDVNAKAGYILWGWQNSNLDLAWYINRPGLYRDRYNLHLPAAQKAGLGM